MINSAERRVYSRRFYIAMTAYVVVTIATTSVVESAGLHGIPAIVLSVLPMAPAAFALAAGVGVYRSLDEFMRKLLSEALMFSWLGVGFLAVTYTFLHNAVAVPYLSGWEVWVTQNVLYAIGIALAMRRYR